MTLRSRSEQEIRNGLEVTGWILYLTQALQKAHIMTLQLKQ